MEKSKMFAKGESALGGKIAVIHSIYQPDYRGGAEVAVENIVTGLKARGEDVFVITVGRNNIVETIDGVKVYRIKPFNLFNFLDINSQPVWLRLPWHLIDMFNDVQTLRVYQVLKKENPDLALTHNLKGLGYYLPWLLRLMKIRQVHTVHDMQLLHPSGLLNISSPPYSATGGQAIGVKGGLPIRPYAWVNRQLFKGVEAVIFPSEYIRQVYRRHGFFPRARQAVLGNPISPKNKKTIRRGGQENDNYKNPQLLFLGQVEEYKGIFDLLAAVKEIKNDFTLHIVGSGSALTRAKELAAADRRIKFYGRLSQEELKQKIWPKIDLLINPTRTPESFGLVIAEAAGHGVPALAANIGAIPELIEEGKTGPNGATSGWLFKPGAVADLKNKLEFLLKNLCSYGAVGLLAKQTSARYELDEYLNRLAEFAKL